MYLNLTQYIIKRQNKSYLKVVIAKTSEEKVRNGYSEAVFEVINKSHLFQTE